MSATQFALRLPELLSSIFLHVLNSEIPKAPPKYSGEFEKTHRGLIAAVRDHESRKRPRTRCGNGNTGSLLQCALVCRLWSHEAVPLLWKRFHPRLWNAYTLSAMLGRVGLSRRQYSADLISTACLPTKRTTGEDDEVYNTVVFSSLTEIRLYVDSWDIHIPAINAPNLTRLQVDPRDHAVYPETCGLTANEWERILDRIASLFPSLVEVEILDWTHMFPDAVPDFVAKMPNLVRCNGRTVAA